MERTVEDFIKHEVKYTPPYNNHYGWGHSVGCGDAQGCGRAFIDTLSEIDREFSYTGKGILSFNNQPTYVIDDYIVYITHVHTPWFMGEIINNDFTTQTCYMVKVNNKYVVASSIKDVVDIMREKIAETSNNAIDIAHAFVLAHPDYNKLYDWDEMVTWHSLDPSSCVEGRRTFSRHAGKRSGDLATPKELITFMKNSPACRIAEKMESLYNI